MKDLEGLRELRGGSDEPIQSTTISLSVPGVVLLSTEVIAHSRLAGEIGRDSRPPHQMALAGPARPGTIMTKHCDECGWRESLRWLAEEDVRRITVVTMIYVYGGVFKWEWWSCGGM